MTTKAIRSPSSPKRGSKLFLPVWTERVIFSPFVRIRKNFVGFIDFLELLFCLLIAGIYIGMILACQLTKCLFDFFRTRSTRDVEYLVIIFVLHWYPAFCFSTLFTPTLVSELLL